MSAHAGKNRSAAELNAVQLWINAAYKKIQDLRMPIRIELTDARVNDEPVYAVQDFLHTGPNSMMTFDQMPTWMQERFVLLLVNPEPMFEIEDVGFCYDHKTFYVKGEETHEQS